MNSPVAETIQLLKTYLPGLGGISPAPVPSTASYPYITVGEIHVGEVENLQGISGLHKTIIQINVWDKSHENAWAKRKQVKDYLLSYRGVAGTQTLRWVGPNVDSMLYDGSRSLHQAVCRLFMWWGA